MSMDSKNENTKYMEENVVEIQDEQKGMVLSFFNAVGVPLLTRSIRTTQPPMTLVSLMSAVYTASLKQIYPITSMHCDSTTISWNMFNESILMVLQSNTSNAVLNKDETKRKLTLIYDALTLLIGIKDLTDTIPNDKIMKQLRGAADYLDVLLRDEEESLGHSVEAVEVLLTDKELQALLVESLDELVQQTGQVLGAALVFENRIIAATDSWWERLKAREITLLVLYVQSLCPSLCRDIPVFLPYFAPGNAKPGTIPFRFFTIQLFAGVEVYMLCGKEPSLQEVEEKLIPEVFTEKYASAIHDRYTSLPKDIPDNFDLDPGILGFLIVNRMTNRVGSCFFPDPKTAYQMPVATRKSILSQFYKTANEFFTFSELLKPTQLYHQTEEYSVVAVKKGYNEMYALLAPSVPQFALVGLVEETLEKITSELVF